MTFYVFLLIGLFFALLYLILTQPAQKSAALLMNAGPFALIVLGVLPALDIHRGHLVAAHPGDEPDFTGWRQNFDGPFRISRDGARSRYG
jgi:hypothetical protein